MALHDFFLKMNLATGGQDPNAALESALAGVGLAPAGRDGARSEYRGHFGGRPAFLGLDGSEVMAAANRAYAAAAGTEIAASFGLISKGFADWRREMNDLRARSGMREARMALMLAIDGGRWPAAPVLIGRDAAAGHAIAPGLHAQTTPEAWPHVAQPYVIGALAAASFDRVRTQPGGTWIEAIWMPPMREYQSIAADPARFAHCAGATLRGLSALADIVCPR